MADYLSLFQDKRLSASEPHHLEYIKGRLASLKVEDPLAYDVYSTYYGVDLDVKVTKEPKVTIKNNQVVAKKKPVKKETKKKVK